MTEHAFDELPAIGPAAITLGVFDGVHCGHQDVLARLTARAEDAGRASLLVTFDPHPREVLDPETAPALLTTRDEKLALLGSTGIDYVAIVPFTAELARRTATEFVDEILHCAFVHTPRLGHRAVSRLHSRVGMPRACAISRRGQRSPVVRCRCRHAPAR